VFNATFNNISVISWRSSVIYDQLWGHYILYREIPSARDISGKRWIWLCSRWLLLIEKVNLKGPSQFFIVFQQIRLSLTCLVTPFMLSCWKRTLLKIIANAGSRCFNDCQFVNMVENYSTNQLTLFWKWFSHE
jgi:hypothetical protein